MKEIKILHLFPSLLSLYGEYGNVRVLARYLEKNGFSVKTDIYEGPELHLGEYDLIYMGSGTEENTEHAAKLLMPYKENIKEAVRNGKLFLVTGNALAVFSQTIENRKNELIDALGIFPFKVTENENRFIGDTLTEPFSGYSVVGFINNSYVINGISSPWFQLKFNKTLGNDKKSAAEGFIYNNFYATSLIGPLLTKNPHILEFFIEKLTDKKISIPEEDSINKAYSVTLEELSKREE